MSTASAKGVIASSTVLPLLSIIVVSLRFHVRSGQKASISIDDWLQIPAVLIFIGMAATALYGVSNKAFGFPTPTTLPTEPAPSLILCEKLWFAIQLMQIVALAIIKIAALQFYRRIFVTRNGTLNKIIWTLQALIVVWCIGFFGYYPGACDSHPEAAWSGYVGFAQYCIKSEKFEQAFGISDFLLDTAVLVVPLPSIWRLHTSTARKLGIMSVFLVALIGYGAAIARLVTFVQLANNALSTALPDVQSTDTQAVWFSNLETGLSLIALNVPAIWRIFSGLRISSLVQSVRSAISLSSRSSPRSGQSSEYDKIDDRHVLRGVLANQPGLELVPTAKKAHFETPTAEDRPYEGQSMEHGNIIRVERSVNVVAG